MKKTLNVCYITGRKNNNLDWFLDSLARQLKPGEYGTNEVRILVIDSNCEIPDERLVERKFEKGQFALSICRRFSPKPTVWQGKHRVTKADWWAASNARNTGLARCETEWIAFLDDRSVLMPTWLQSVREAMEGNYAVCGAYEKRINMKVENGAIIQHGESTGTDHRLKMARGNVMNCPGQWFYTGTFALPLEWALTVNGFEELLDGLGAEDTQFGAMLCNNGYAVKYDPRMMIVEDRTPGEIGEPFRKESKERFSHDAEDKGHKAIEKFYGNKQAQHPFNLRELREKVLKGEPFPIPTEPTHDWFDGQPISTFGDYKDNKHPEHPTWI